MAKVEKKNSKLFWLENFGEKKHIICPQNNLFSSKNELLYSVSKTITNWQLTYGILPQFNYVS